MASKVQVPEAAEQQSPGRMVSSSATSPFEISSEAEEETRTPSRDSPAAETSCSDTGSNKPAGLEEASSPRRRCPDSFFLLEGIGSKRLPVEGARLYNLAARPVPLPSGKLKLLVLPVFGVICYGWGILQRKAQLDLHLPGEPGQVVEFERSLPGNWQVLLNALCVVALSAYAIAAYLLSQRTMEWVLNPLFTPRTWAGHVGMSVLMFAIAIAASFTLSSNWVVGASGIFMFMGWVLCGRTVQESVSARGQVGLGPSRAPSDGGASFFHRGGEGCAEEGGAAPAEKRTFQARLIRAGQEAEGTTIDGRRLRFASVLAAPDAVGDDAVLLEQKEDGSFTYHAPCGRANIFRWDCLLIYAFACVANLPHFVLGAGGFNQCVGVPELVTAFIYVPVGYSCFAVWGFRLGLASPASTGIAMVLTAWPVINLMLGGKGCMTLVHLVAGVYLPQIWDPAASSFEFNRGFASCSESAYALGGETLLVASTTIAAWVHIMSNFSFLFGFIYGLAKKYRSSEQSKGDVVTVA